MKKLFFTLISFIGCSVVAMADCPPAATSSSNVVLTQRVAKVGMLKGEFSVSATKKVSFSKGNLQYQASTKTWRFAENQWDALGGTGGGGSFAPVAPLNVASGNNTSPEASRAEQALWIDLFHWGTSGKDGIGEVNQPWKTTGNPGPAISSGEWTSEDYDWGVVNAGQLGSGWRTLTKNEWVYLVETRKGANNAYLCARGIVHSIRGVILLPDGWRQVNSAITQTLQVGVSGNYSNNTITDDNWAALEKEGAVFLPAGGWRDGTNVYGANNFGHYWSSTAGSTSSAYYVYIPSDTGSIGTNSSGARNRAASVRLVHEL